ncbi:pPR-type GPCR protein [Radiomyces spectabilis]|uniref:pPR-type GPCR protein n=1 Tax=Radiomyces spectabilis TaxID=64574 RepID=UPI0022203558|nr:pPR-type GPCR protein [Radiomyces spectabilis]KAI8369433.1 pPR-type GPCR protein [Radiomyces spectabilis]
MGVQRRTMHRATDDDDSTTGLLAKPSQPPQHKSKTLTWNEIPKWMQDNQYITTGYRYPTGSYTGCIKTLFFLHNESVNIWSHLIGFLVFVWLGVDFLYNQPFSDSLTTFDIAYFLIFIGGALCCLGFSSSFHCFSCHSEPVAITWNRCDYAGITTLIVGSYFPVVYYGFHCHHALQTIYLSIVAVLGSCTAAVTLLKHFRTPAYRWVRTSLFLALGCFGVVPTLHGIYLYGLRNSFETISLSHMAMMGLSYISGALIYGCRVPERFRPGLFDIWGASHQIFHLAVVAALWAHYTGVLKAMAFWHDKNNNMCATFLP